MAILPNSVRAKRVVRPPYPCRRHVERIVNPPAKIEISHRLEVSVSSTNCYRPHWDCMVGGTVVPNLPASDFPRGANGRIGPAARGRITRESER